MLAEAVRALGAQLGEPEGPPEALDGGITNRNYRVRWSGRDCVLRIPGRDTAVLGIARDAELAAARAAAALGIAPEVVAYEPRHGCLVTAYVDGRPLDPAALRARLPEIAAALRRFHAGGPLPSRFDAFAVAADYLRIARERGGAIPPAAPALVAAARRIRDALTGPEHAPVPCHDDLLAANLLHDGERLWIVDWEYAGMGDRYFDLGNLAVNNELGEDDEERLLAAYWGEPATPRRLAALRLMRIASSLREGMWGVVQGAVSELEFDFAGYAAEHLEHARAALADPRLGAWLEVTRGG